MQGEKNIVSSCQAVTSCSSLLYHTAATAVMAAMAATEAVTEAVTEAATEAATNAENNNEEEDKGNGQG